MGFSTSVMPSVILSRETFIKVHHGRDFWLGKGGFSGLTLIFGVLYRPMIVHPGTTTGLYGIPVWEKLTGSGARHVRGSTMQRLFNAKTIISWISDCR